MRKLSISALSSLNYLFLKKLTKKVSDEYVNIVLGKYLIDLNEGVVDVTSDIKEMILTEMYDGTYFEGHHDIVVAESMLKDVIEELTEEDINDVMDVYTLYRELIKQTIQDNRIEQQAERQARS